MVDPGFVPGLIGVLLQTTINQIVRHIRICWTWKNALADLKDTLVRIEPIVELALNNQDEVSVVDNWFQELYALLKQASEIVEKCITIRSWDAISRLQTGTKISTVTKDIDKHLARSGLVHMVQFQAQIRKILDGNKQIIEAVAAHSIFASISQAGHEPVGITNSKEEARALLGRLEYQRGNIEAALQVFEGIDINTIGAKMRQSIVERAQKLGSRRGHSHTGTGNAMSMQAVSLLLEAILLKAKSLQELGLAKEAAQQCKFVLETVESALPRGMPDAFGEDDCKLQETVSKAVELLPELWKQAGLFHEAIASYRRALINPWSLDFERSARIQKEFAIFLLYGGIEAGPPSLGSQVEGAFIPRNNIEEAILLLFILLKNFALKKIPWDPTIMDHLTFALSMSGQFETLAEKFEEVIPGIYNRSDRWYTLALCYSAAGQDDIALNLVRKTLDLSEKPDHSPAALLAAKLCGKSSKYAHEGVHFSRRVLETCECKFDHMKGVASHLLGVALGRKARSVDSVSERTKMQHEALIALEEAAVSENKDPEVMFSLALENAEQRNLNIALDCAMKYLAMMDGASLKGWKLLALVLSAQQRFSDAEIIIDTAFNETGKWQQGELLRLKAKLQIAQGQSMHAFETYKLLIALVQAKRKPVRAGNSKLRDGDDRVLELEAWQDLAYLYINLGKWHDGELCLEKTKAIKPHSAISWHAKGLLYEGQSLYKEALVAFSNAIAIEPDHVPSMISIASVLRQLGEKSLPPARSFLTDALELEPTNHMAWFGLGMVHKMEGCVQKAADCFQDAYLLQESAPVEKFSSVSGHLHRTL